MHDLLKLDLSTFQMFLHIISVMNEWLTLYISRQDICRLHIVCITTKVPHSQGNAPVCKCYHRALHIVPFLNQYNITLVRD